MPKLFALIDCNAFYVSCERVFNPNLAKRPVVVLSNNDGCIIARSKEAKLLGIPMGAPLFQYQKLLDHHRVATCSSNYTLYGDMSQRVMQILREFSPDMQIYSIDEAFLIYEGDSPIEFGKQIRERVLKWTGIPVSVGLGPTKTLAKTANHLAKAMSNSGQVISLDTPESILKALEKLPVKEVWGIGSRISEFLRKEGIWSADAFRNCNDLWIRKHLGVVGLRMAWELRGTSCLPLEEAPPPKKSIISSRAFGRPITTLQELEEAVASHAARAGEKMRIQNSLASSIGVLLESHPFSERSTLFGEYVFPEPSAYTPYLIHRAKLIAQKIFNPALEFRKAGILLNGLIPKSSFQPDLFAPSHPSPERQERAMKLLDAVNQRAGYKALRFAAEGIEKPWQMRREQCSPHYTTSWEDLLKIKI